MSPELSLQAVSKRFVHRRHRQPIYRELVRAFRGGSEADDVLALDRLDLELSGPTSIGLVGPNGAGKSSLMRIIAGIYRPDSGDVRVSGRVACFFGGKAGVAPTLSVRDNVWIQSAINGLTRAETVAGMAGVLEFAELTSHADTRVEHLSFGMRQRLSFAVTLHTMRVGKADIYLFDEWMAGADARFKEKVEDAIGELDGSPRMVVYASHDLARLRRMCDEVLYMRAGVIRLRGSASEVIDAYLEECGGRDM